MKNGYIEEKFLSVIKTLKKEVQLDRKELLNFEKDFEILSKINR